MMAGTRLNLPEANASPMFCATIVPSTARTGPPLTKAGALAMMSLTDRDLRHSAD